MNQEQEQTTQTQESIEQTTEQPASTKYKYTIRLNMFQLTPEERSRLADLYFGGMLAISALIFQSLLSQTNLDSFSFFALLCFIGAFPTLSGALITRFAYKRVTRATLIVGFLGSLCALCGIVSTLLHISWIAAAVFSGAIFLTVNIIEWFDPHSHW